MCISKNVFCWRIQAKQQNQKKKKKENHPLKKTPNRVDRKGNYNIVNKNFKSAETKTNSAK